MKKAVSVVSLFSVLALSGCTLFPSSENPESSSSASSASNASAESSLPVGWNRYVGDGVSFAYPQELLSVNQNENVILSHQVPSQHIDPCDFKGDAPELSMLTDFHVKIELTGSTLIDAAGSRMHWIADDKELYVDGDELVTSDGFITDVEFDHVSGYEIQQGVEGCGQKVYFLENDAGQTVIVTRRLITELSNAVTNTDEYLKIPGVIKPEEEDELFLQIMDTLLRR